MRSIILLTATSYLLPLLLLLSVYLLLHGHDYPGGGFVGGMVASAAFALYVISRGVEESRKMIRVDPRILIGAGLLTALASGCVSLFAAKPFLTGLWIMLGLTGEWKMGTPVLFDVGVYFVVVGATLTIIFSLAEE